MLFGPRFGLIKASQQFGAVNSLAAIAIILGTELFQLPLRREPRQRRMTIFVVEYQPYLKTRI